MRKLLSILAGLALAAPLCADVTGNVTPPGGNAGVSKIVAGSGVSVSPLGGTGAVTVSATGTVTSVTCGNGLTGGTITTSGTCDLGGTTTAATTVGSGGSITTSGTGTNVATSVVGPASTYVDICYWAATTTTPCGDTQLVDVAVTTTAGSTAATIATTIPANCVGGNPCNIVIAGAGVQTIKSVVISSAGTGYTVGDTLTVTGGTLSAGGAAATITVLSITGGGTTGPISTAAMLTGGGYSTLPTSPVSVTGGTGSGSPTFTTTTYAWPLATTIAGTGVSNAVTLGASAGNSLNGTVWLAFGHCDDTTAATALASGYTYISLSRNKMFSTCAGWSFNSANRLVLDGQGSTIVGLGSITDQWEVTPTGTLLTDPALGSAVINTRFEAMGQANHNVEHQGFGWRYENNMYRNALVSAITIDSTAQSNTISGGQVENNLSIVPIGPAYGIDQEYYDNKVESIDISQVQLAGLYHGSTSAGNFAEHVHVYSVSNGPCYLLTGGKAFLTADRCDGPLGAYGGVYSTTSGTTVTGFHLQNPGSNTGQYAVNFASGSANSVGVNITGTGITASNGCINAGGTTNGFGGYNPVCNNALTLNPGSQSAASWTTNGLAGTGVAATLTDTTANTTIATETAYKWPVITFTSSNSATFTNATEVEIPAPLCTGPLTCTNLDSLVLDGRLNVVNGIAASGAINMGSGANAINLGISGTEQITLGNSSGGTTILAGQSKFTDLSTGTNADTLCLTAGQIVTVDAGNTCSVSSRRFKENIKPITATVLPALKTLPVVSFNRKPDAIPNPDPNFAAPQVGLIAEDVAKLFPQCALYESDMATVKSWREMCMIAMLVKGMQEQSREIARLKHRHH